MSEITSLHRKYRPNTLKRVIGHTAAVTRMQGMVETGKYPNAILIVGATSAGKTTLARCFAAAVNGVKDADRLGVDYMEINCTDKRTIEDVRDLIGKSRYKPTRNKRIIVLDEAQGLLSNPQAAAALLKPLEEPSPNTIWILCSMDPAKFSSGNGKAIAGRCTQFVLENQTEESLTKQCKRILKGEGMLYARGLVEDIVRGSGGEMRTLANIVEGVQQYYNGLSKKPKKLGKEAVADIMKGSLSKDEDQVIPVLTGIYTGQFKQAQAALLDVTDGVRFINSLLHANSFLLNVQAVGKHPKIWWTPLNRELHKAVEALVKKKHPVNLGTLAATNMMLVEAKAMINNFTVSAEEALSSYIYKAIKTIFTQK